MADSLLEETNLQLQGAMLVLDDLFYCHLQRSCASTLEESISTFVVQSGYAESDFHCASYRAALNHGFQPLKELSYFSIQDGCYKHSHPHLEVLDLEEEDLDAMVFDVSTGMERYAKRSDDIGKLIFNIMKRLKPAASLEMAFE